MSFSSALQALGFSKSPRALEHDASQGVVSKGTFYRVWADVDEGYVDRIYTAAPASLGQTNVQEQLGLDLAQLGFDLPLLVVQDPSDPKVWTLLARWALPDHKTPAEAGPFRFLRFDPVEAPARSSPLVDVASLDVGLSHNNVNLLVYELCHDNDPKRLAGLARAFDEDFPIAASLVRTKARLEDLVRCTNLETGPIDANEHDNGTLQPSSPTNHATLDALRDASRDVDGGAYLNLFSHVFDALDWPPPAIAQEHGHDVLFALEPELDAIPDQERAVMAGKMLSCLSRTPSLARVENIPDLERQTGLPRAVVAAAVAAVSDLGHGLAAVDPDIARTLMPHGPKPVSLGALKMAHAILRPEGSLAAAPAELGGVLKDLQKSVRNGDAFAILADEALNRARRSLDRQNWAAWVARYRTAEKQS